MGWARTAAVVGLAAAAGTAGAQTRQEVTGPTAVYWMSAQTTSGMAAMMGAMGAGPGAGGPGARRPSMGAMMGMMMGGGLGGPGGMGAAQHSLTLQLGSARTAQGAPSAEHLPPQGLGAGPSLPLVTPTAAPAQRVEEEPTLPQEYQKPRGRMLIFWGCGAEARPGQPLVIDFSKLTPQAMAAGQLPPGFEAMSRGLAITPMRPPAPGRNATYGEWPNARTRTSVPGEGSLVGAHTVRGNYTPQIEFQLAQNQDFLAPLRLRTSQAPSGAGLLNWGAIPGAKAYLATAIGGGDGETVVLWTSSEVQASAFSLPDYISPGDLDRLVQQKALMAPATTQCAIPRQVVAAAPQAMVQLAAYGGEANFVYPPRPSDPKVPWKQEWQVKVRYRSATSAMLGMDMDAMMGGDDEEEAPRRPFGLPRF
ncbi:MAG: hypothetical protein ACK4YQ_06390 [Phenylobacterium sp.]|uniref:hypothetical protein n=1 Tax=Phenylobacterium sp. TaxID=1871053 RepID=UPI003918E0DF